MHFWHLLQPLWCLFTLEVTEDFGEVAEMQTCLLLITTLFFLLPVGPAEPLLSVAEVLEVVEVSAAMMVTPLRGYLEEPRTPG